jgi:HPt (histidine-containing phosphotransfer) domain-containing protein
MTLVRDPSIDALLHIARTDFATRLPARVAELEALVGRRAWEEARRAAHKLRGSAAAYGFPAVGQGAAAIEEALLTATGEPETAALARIVAEMATVRVAADRAAAGGS